MSEKVELTEAEKAVVVEVTVGEIQGWLAAAHDLGVLHHADMVDNGNTYENPWRD